MDFKILEQILKNELLDLKVNHYETNFNGTIKLAEYHLKLLKRCSSARSDKTTLEMYYNNELFGFIDGQTPSTNSLEAIRTANNKLKAEKLLIENHIRTTESMIFGEEEFESAKSLINDSDYPMVVKPYNLNAGRGITLNVDASNFPFAWGQALKAYEQTTKKFKVLIQPMLPGIETRMLIVEGKFNSSILRVPSNVTGDGKSSIKGLVELKNIERKANPHLKKLPLKITEMVEHNIKRNSLDVDSVPDKDEVVFLHSSSNISLGGDSYEVSHLINDQMKLTAESAVRSIPGLTTAGVDILFKSFKDQDPAVLEINPGANLRMHHYPWKGSPKTPVFDLIDDMLLKFKQK